MRIARRDQAAVGHQEQRVGPFDLGERHHQRLDDVGARVARHEVQDDLGVAGGLEDRAALFELGADRRGVGEVAVVHDADRPHRGLDHDRLGVGDHRRAGGRVARVPHRPPPREARQHLVREDLGDVPHAALDVHALAVPGADAGALLAAMLQRVEAEVGEVRRVVRVVDAEDAAHDPFAPPP